MRMINFKKFGFTLTEVLIAIAIIGVIAGLLLPILMSNFQKTALEHQYTREVNAIADSVYALSVAENKASFFDTMMYSESDTGNYTDTAGKFMKKYLRVAKDCGNSNGNCFAKKYYEYKDKNKTDYTPEYKGYCASLKNGISICMTPQIGGANIVGIMDLNGPKAPNIYGRDLRYFIIDPKQKKAFDKTTGDVLAEAPYLVTPKKPPCTSCDCNSAFCPPVNVCDENPNGADCCLLRAGSITSYTDPCCSHSSVKAVQSACTPPPPPPCTTCDCNPDLCPPPPCTSCSCNPTLCKTPGGGGGDALPVGHMTCHIKKLVLDGNSYYAEFSGHASECRPSVVYQYGATFSYQDEAGNWVNVDNGELCRCPTILSGTLNPLPKSGSSVTVQLWPGCEYGEINPYYPAAGDNFCWVHLPPWLHITFPFEKNEYSFPHKDPTY